MAVDLVVLGVVLEVLVLVLLGIHLFILCFCLLAKGFPGFVYGVLSVVLLFVPVLLLVLVLLASPFLEFLPVCLAFALCGRCLPAHLFLVFAVLLSLLLLVLLLASLLRILCSCYNSDNSPVYRGCPVQLRPLATVF